MRGSRLCIAVVQRDVATVEEMMASEEKEQFIDAAVGLHEGRTALHEACMRGHLEIAKSLVDNGADRNVCDKSARSPLHWACCNGHVEIIRLLQSNGGCIPGFDTDGCSPLMLASRHGRVDAVKELVKDLKAITDKRITNTRLNWTPLHEASDRGHAEVVLVLAAHGAPLNGKTDKGMTALHLACERGCVDTVRALCHSGADVRVRNDAQDTPLHLALVCVQFAAAFELLLHGADIHAANGRSLTVYQLAPSFMTYLFMRREMAYQSRKRFLMFLAQYQFLRPPLKSYRREGVVEKVFATKDLQRYITKFL